MSDTNANETPTEAVLLDIEGTTTSISFVYDELFPFARRAVGDFLARHIDDPEVRDDIRLLREEMLVDAVHGHEHPSFGGATGGQELAEAATRRVLWLMDQDRKSTGLKSLQGKIWKDGYASGELKGHLFEDVKPTLEALAARGVPVYIYSSGSVEAQKLLFGHSIEGDLTPLLAGYFDTTTGGKKEASSYRAIAEAIGAPPEAITFVTDNPDEATAATEAGLRVLVSVRPGNGPLPEGASFETVASLDALL